MFYYVTPGCLQQQQHNLWLYKFSTIQWRIWDFPFGGGGAEPLGGHFLAKNVCENERIRSSSEGGHVLAVPPLDPPMYIVEKTSGF